MTGPNKRVEPTGMGVRATRLVQECLRARGTNAMPFTRW
jgi:hypothetical protein